MLAKVWSTASCWPDDVATEPRCAATILLLAPASCSACWIARNAPTSTPPATSTATLRVAMLAPLPSMLSAARRFQRQLGPHVAKSGAARRRLGVRHGDAQRLGHLARQLGVHMGQVVHHPLADGRHLDLRQLELEGRNDVLLLRRALAVPEQRGLAEVIVEAGAAAAQLGRLHRFGKALEALLAPVDPELGAVGQRVRLVADLALVDQHAVHAVALEVVERADAPVDRDLVEIGRRPGATAGCRCTRTAGLAAADRC